MHINNVSNKGPIISKNPALIDLSVFNVAITIGDEPRPDSLEKIPREIPLLIMTHKLAPKVAFTEKASVIIK